MKPLSCLLDTGRDNLRNFRKQYKLTNKNMAEYEQQIYDKDIKQRSRTARLRLKKAIKEYNLLMESIR